MVIEGVLDNSDNYIISTLKRWRKIKSYLILTDLPFKVLASSGADLAVTAPSMEQKVTNADLKMKLKVQNVKVQFSPRIFKMYLNWFH